MNEQDIARRDALAEKIYGQLHISTIRPWSRMSARRKQQYFDCATMVMALNDKEVKEHARRAEAGVDER